MPWSNKCFTVWSAKSRFAIWRRQDQLYWGSQRHLGVVLQQIGLVEKSKIKLGLERSSVGKVLALQANDLSLVPRSCVQVAEVAHVCNPSTGEGKPARSPGLADLSLAGASQTHERQCLNTKGRPSLRDNTWCLWAPQIHTGTCTHQHTYVTTPQPYEAETSPWWKAPSLCSLWLYQIYAL